MNIKAISPHRHNIILEESCNYVFKEYINNMQKKNLTVDWESISLLPIITIDIVLDYEEIYEYIDIVLSNTMNATDEFIELVKHNTYGESGLKCLRNNTLWKHRNQFHMLPNFHLNREIIIQYTQSLRNYYYQLNKSFYQTVLNEYMEVCLIPENMPLMKKLGVYSDIDISLFM